MSYLHLISTVFFGDFVVLIDFAEKSWRTTLFVASAAGLTFVSCCMFVGVSFSNGDKGSNVGDISSENIIIIT